MWFDFLLIRLRYYRYNSDTTLHQKEQELLFVGVVYQRDVNSQFWAPLRPMIFVLFVLWSMLRQSQRQDVTQLVFPGRRQLDRRSVGAKPNSPCSFPPLFILCNVHQMTPNPKANADQAAVSLLRQSEGLRRVFAYWNLFGEPRR